MNPSIPENKKISPFLIFFILHKMQVGIGVLGFQRIIAKSAGYDAWISIILMGIGIHIIIWMMYKMLKISGGDFLSIHQYIFGKKISKLIGSIFILYFCLLSVAILRNYIEILQVWMFPELKTLPFAFIFLLLALYIVYGGLRAVTGAAFFGVVLPFYIVIVFLFTIPFADFTNLLPVFDHSIKEILIGTKDMTLTVLGFEVLLFVHPFIKTPEKSKKWAQFGILFTTIYCLYLAILTFAYFPEEQLQKNIWSTLTMWKIIEMPFVERFEYIGIANWAIIILPNICIALWCASRLAKQIFSIKQKTALPFLAGICLIVTSSLLTRNHINLLLNLVGQIGFYFNFVYIPLLFFAILIVKKVKKL